MYHLFTGCPLFFVRDWVGVETVGVPGAPGVDVMGVDPEGVGRWKGVCGREVWFEAPWTEALCGGRSWRPEVAVRRAEEEEKRGAKEGGACEREPGC